MYTWAYMLLRRSISKFLILTQILLGSTPAFALRTGLENNVKKEVRDSLSPSGLEESASHLTLDGVIQWLDQRLGQFDQIVFRAPAAPFGQPSGLRFDPSTAHSREELAAAIRRELEAYLGQQLERRQFAIRQQNLNLPGSETALFRGIEIALELPLTGIPQGLHENTTPWNAGDNSLRNQLSSTLQALRREMGPRTVSFLFLSRQLQLPYQDDFEYDEPHDGDQVERTRSLYDQIYQQFRQLQLRHPVPYDRALVISPGMIRVVERSPEEGRSLIEPLPSQYTLTPQLPSWVDNPQAIDQATVYQRAFDDQNFSQVLGQALRVYFEYPYILGSPSTRDLLDGWLDRQFAFIRQAASGVDLNEILAHEISRLELLLLSRADETIQLLPLALESEKITQSSYPEIAILIQHLAVQLAERHSGDVESLQRLVDIGKTLGKIRQVRPRVSGDLRRMAQHIETLLQVARLGQSGLEEPITIDQFMERFGASLDEQTRAAVEMHRRRGATQIWLRPETTAVVPKMGPSRVGAAAQQEAVTVPVLSKGPQQLEVCNVYVKTEGQDTALDPQATIRHHADWQVAVQNRLPQGAGGLYARVWEYPAEPDLFSENAVLWKDRVVIIHEAGAFLNPLPPENTPVLTFGSVEELNQLTPSVIYWALIDEGLRKQDISGFLHVTDASGSYVAFFA